MVQRILQLRSQSTPIHKIAAECGLTTGQARYQLAKANNTNPMNPQRSETKNDVMESEKAAPKKHDILHLRQYSQTMLHASWTVTCSRMQMVASYLHQDYQSLQKGIRLYDVTGLQFNGSHAHELTDVPLSFEAADCFIPNVRNSRTYIAEFGFFDKGRFCPILRSEALTTPAHNTSWTRLFRLDTETYTYQLSQQK